MREVCNGLRYLAKCETPRRLVPHDLPPWEVVGQQTQRWIRGQAFEAMVHDLREMLRLREPNGRKCILGLLAAQVEQATGENVELAWVDQGYTGPAAAEAAQQQGMQLEVVKLPTA
ncbi:MAG TPA: hypothetical protein VFQ91_19765 [Bryobacteraceae bacterium]|nr:hypothetical protein [Bryobacteraceae bacterium]